MDAYHTTLICMESNEGDAYMRSPDSHLVIENEQKVTVNETGFIIPYPRKDGLGIMISFVGVRMNEPIGTFVGTGMKGNLKVLPGIGVRINTIGTTPLPVPRSARINSSQIPESYREIYMTGLYIDINKVNVQLSRPMRLDGIVSNHVTSLFHGPRVETIVNGVCKLCHQKTNHPFEECPRKDAAGCGEPLGPYMILPMPDGKENAIDNGVRFDSAPEGVHYDELKAKFEEYGKVKRLCVSSYSKRRGMVSFENIDDAERALNALKDEFQMYWFV